MAKDLKKNKKVKVLVPLGVKLAFILGAIVLVSLGAVTYLNSYFIGEDVKITAEENNLSVNTRAASTVNDKINAIRGNAFQLLDLVDVVSEGRDSPLASQASDFFFEHNPDIASIHIISHISDLYESISAWNILNARFFSSNEIEVETDERFLREQADAIERSCGGEVIALNASPYFAIPSMALLFPYNGKGLSQTCIITFSIESISNILGTNSTNTTFMINDANDLLSHPENERVVRGENMSSNPLVEQIRSENQNNNSSRQIPYSEFDGNGIEQRFFGAYQKLDFADIVMITTVPLDTILEGVNITRVNNILLTIVVFCISTIIILFYSRFGISKPIRRLTDAASEIQNGNFDSSSIDLNLKRGDEIGVLNNSIMAEFGFLNTFARFTNKGVAKAIARNEIDFDPHLKDITIFFSDIRGFTAISDGFKQKFGSNSPREIISFLNDYMSRMVECITLSGGIVDKFEGDAIMATWGILREDSIDFEKLPRDDPRRKKLAREHRRHVINDALNACKGSIAMRYSLMKYNKDAMIFTKQHENDAQAKYKPYIKIGRGLNTGRATAGILGSNAKMEYTAIGDAVNFASRTEAANKPCGTDMLITQDTYNLLKRDYIRCPENNFTLKPENEEDEIIVEMIPVGFDVKGKGMQHFYGVVNMPKFDIEKFFRQGDPNFVVDKACSRVLGPNGPKTLNEARKLLGIPIPDFEKVNLNEEENKIQVQK